ncbi:tyrosine-type recombinase/integrase [Halomonas sp. GFAJ-1]|uniref:tyrosine-type recombinase/integrase n=1 Tax=Halomonas sp. GFAJ-1 TaxID=1118153 RepID=UPI00023A206C|nr:integrase [Halomonas sp. GFAJ-1]EHK59513.1 phage integrase family protein [Halomonas sp. GFAJ-1]
MAQAKTLSKTELKRVLQYIDACERYSERNRAMLLLTHWCGMRVGEVASLRVSDVVSEDGSIRSEIRLTASQTKGKRARVVYVPSRMRKELQNYVQRSTKPARSVYLFNTQKSQRFTANTATQLLQRLYARAGIEGATSHSGRRTFITELAGKGVSVRVLAELAGHQSIQTTQRYIDVNDDMLRKAIESI